MSDSIKFHSRDPKYGWLSNFHVQGFVDTFGRHWESVEHFYQAGKAVHWEDHERIREATSPLMARRIGQSIKIRKDWDTAKLPRMYMGLLLKFNPATPLTKKLIDTGSRELIHLTPWGKEGDPYWGIGRHNDGQNRLGKMIAAIRTQWRRRTISNNVNL